MPGTTRNSPSSAPTPTLPAASAPRSPPKSTAEQAGAGLDRCTPAEFEEFHTLNTRYVERFGFPFIIAVKGHGRASILAAFRRRVEGERDAEFRVALDEVHKIAGFRLAALAAPREVAREAVPVDEVRALAFAALTRAGADEANAAAIAENIAAAEAGGSESHGLFRLPGYVKGLGSGAVNGTAEPVRLDGPDAAVIVDARGGAAPLAYERFLPVLADLAAEKGAAVLALRNAVHFAAMWPEVEALAARGARGVRGDGELPLPRAPRGPAGRARHQPAGVRIPAPVRPAAGVRLCERRDGARRRDDRRPRRPRRAARRRRRCRGPRDHRPRRDPRTAARSLRSAHTRARPSR